MNAAHVHLGGRHWGLSAPTGEDGRKKRFFHPVRVNFVDPAGVAHRAGVRVGDIVTALNDRPVEKHVDLSRKYVFVDDHSQRVLCAGGDCKLTILRAKSPMGPACRNCNSLDLDGLDRGEIACRACATVQGVTFVCPDVWKDMEVEDTRTDSRALQRLISNVESIANYMESNACVLALGKKLCRNFYSSGKRKVNDDTREILAAACILVSSRCHGYATTQKDVLKFCQRGQGGIKRLASFVKKLRNFAEVETGAAAAPPTVISLITRFCNDLEQIRKAKVDFKLRRDMEFFARELERFNICESRMAASKSAGVIALVCILYAPIFDLDAVATATSQAPATLREVCRDIWESIAPSKGENPDRVKLFFPREVDCVLVSRKIRSSLFRVKC